MFDVSDRDAITDELLADADKDAVEDVVRTFVDAAPEPVLADVVARRRIRDGTAEPDAVFRSVVGRLHDDYTLFYPSRGESFEPEEVGALAAGALAGVDWDDPSTHLLAADNWQPGYVVADWVDHITSVRDEVAVECARNACEDIEEAVLRSSGRFADLCDEVRARDVSDPVADLLSNTPDQMLRYDLGHVFTDKFGCGDAAGIAEVTGLGDDDPAVQKLARATKPGDRLYVLWRGPAAAAVRVANPVGGSPDDDGRVGAAAFSDAHLLTVGPAGGGGFAVKVPGEMRVPLRPRMVQVDEGSAVDGHYTWSAVAETDLNASPARVSVELDPVAAPPTASPDIV